MSRIPSAIPAALAALLFAAPVLAAPPAFLGDWCDPEGDPYASPRSYGEAHLEDDFNFCAYDLTRDLVETGPGRWGLTTECRSEEDRWEIRRDLLVEGDRLTETLLGDEVSPENRVRLYRRCPRQEAQ